MCLRTPKPAMTLGSRCPRLHLTGGRLHGALFGLGIVCVVLAWLIATPAGGVPDEVDQYARALSVGAGTWLGSPVQSLSGLFQNRTEAQSVLLTTRKMTVSARPAPPAAWTCLMLGALVSVRGMRPGLPANLPAYERAGVN